VVQQKTNIHTIQRHPPWEKDKDIKKKNVPRGVVEERIVPQRDTQQGPHRKVRGLICGRTPDPQENDPRRS